MKNRNKWIVGGLAAIVLIVAIFLGTNSELFKGQFFVKPSADSFQPNKKNCALAARWAAEGTYTKNVLARGWPHTDDSNGDGVPELVVERKCNSVGYPVDV